MGERAEKEAVSYESRTAGRRIKISVNKRLRWNLTAKKPTEEGEGRRGRGGRTREMRTVVRRGAAKGKKKRNSYANLA